MFLCSTGSLTLAATDRNDQTEQASGSQSNGRRLGDRAEQIQFAVLCTIGRCTLRLHKHSVARVRRCVGKRNNRREYEPAWICINAEIDRRLNHGPTAPERKIGARGVRSFNRYRERISFRSVIGRRYLNPGDNARSNGRGHIIAGANPLGYCRDATTAAGTEIQILASLRGSSSVRRQIATINCLRRWFTCRILASVCGAGS